MPSVELRPLKPSDRAYAEELLAENDLPTADLDFSSLGSEPTSRLDSPAGSDPDSSPTALFVCESADGERVGVGGLEVGDEEEVADKEEVASEAETEDPAGLLRSVAVEESARGAGYGTAICEQLLDRARAADLGEVFLLTTTAEEFFADLGFERVEREQVPDSIRASAEFSDLCPDSATCMRTNLK
ncbi:GNAT family N-acetyltransferase [Halorussus ruber]|uniref:GNAT family N-acetyltransferase n=1 Tax=Halorussus ruber TaxID=1126238 RepID=UPI0010925A51|nr:GNAT family N-acetyltransferase [Halorussus ruber]